MQSKLTNTVTPVSLHSTEVNAVVPRSAQKTIVKGIFSLKSEKKLHVPNFR